MTKWILGFFLFFVAIALYFLLGYSPPDMHYNHHKVTAAEFNRRFTTAELKSDVDFMVETLQEVHPDLYYYVPKEEFVAFKIELEKQLTQLMTRREFYPFVARLAAHVGDGHTYAIYPHEEWQDFVERDGRVFPFDVDISENGWRVTHSYSRSNVQPGDWIVTINQRPVSSLSSDFLQMTSGEKLTYKRASIERRLRWMLWLHGIHSPFQIEFLKENNGKPFQVEVDGVTMKQIRSQMQNPGGKEKEYYTYRLLEENIGYIDFRSMIDLRVFEKFLKQTFEQIHETGVRGLIVDLRKNGGGSTELGKALLSYITDRPYRFNARVEWKVSRQLKQYLHDFLPAWLRWLPLQYVHPIGRKIWTTPEGELAVWQFEPEPPPANPLRFKGPVCVLIGPYTFSSAVKLANAIGDFNLATLIGEETGGNPNAFGEIYMFDLPNTRLQVAVSTKRFVRANGDVASRGGVMPHIQIEQSEEDLIKGVDTTLEFAKKWILQQITK